MYLKRVVITGIGALTPIGNNINTYWNSLIKGISGADYITYFNTKNFKTKFACQLKEYNSNNFFSKKEVKKIDLCAQYGLLASEEAIKDSKLEFDMEDTNRIGVIWGSGIGGILSLEQEITSYISGNKIPRFSPFFITKMIIDTTPGLISIKYGLKGPNYATVSACSSSANSIIDAYYSIILNKADIIISGGSEAAITQSGLGGFNSIRALSTKNNNPQEASRPFDRDRDGFVLGEGAGCVVLEEYNHAKNRKAKIYAEIIGVGMSADAYHITAPNPYGLGVVRSMENAIKDSKIDIKKIDHINTHGTSTILGDLSEINAIKKVFKKNFNYININSTKSMTGHLLGAAGAIECIATILTIFNNIVPPTINQFNLDDSIDYNFNLTKNTAQKRDVNIAMSNNLGFGGHNVSIIFKKFIN